MFLTSKAMSFPRSSSSAGDPHFDKVSLLLHMDGAQGGTTFVDSSKYGHAITVNGVTTDQSVKQFGSASGYIGFGNTTNCLTLPGHVSHAFGTDDFTVEAFVYPTGRPASSIIYASSSALYSEGFALYVNPSGQLALWSFPDHTNILVSSEIVPLSQFSRVAAVRASGQLRLAIGASLTAPVANATSYGSGEKISVGAYGYGITGYSWPGYIDEVRVTKGVARDVSTIPTAPFPNQ